MSDGIRRRLAPPPSGLMRESFLEVYGGVYEHARWVAEAVWPRTRGGSLDTPESLHKAMREVVEAAPEVERLALIRTHPELAGRTRLPQALTTSSRLEQAGAGLDRLAPALQDEFAELNRQYRERFGFPFVIAVHGLSADEILAAFRRRLGNTLTSEFANALEEIHKISRLRLEAMREMVQQ